ncbi:MAG: uroporphyrinogen-III synthase [Devosia sp.]
MSLTLAVTRPEPQASETASKLRALGHDTILSPLLQVEALAPPGTPDGLSGVLLTSRTAARLLADWPDFHATPCLCVGAATAEEARAAGFASVRDAGGDVDALLAMAVRTGKGPFVHLAGEAHTGDLVERLAEAGVRAQRRIVYRMVAAECLPEAGRLDAVLLYSPRTAEVFQRLATVPPWVSATALALSAAVAVPLRGRRVLLAARPNEAALFDRLPDVARA